MVSRSLFAWRSVLSFSAVVVGLGAGSASAQTTGGTVATSTTLISYPTYFHKYTVNSANEITVYAGRTDRDCTIGNASFTPGTTTATCNSCAKIASTAISAQSGFDLICNKTEIYPDLLFTVALSSSKADAYVNCPDKLITMKVAGATGSLTAPVPGTQTAYVVGGGANQQVSASFRWSQICTLMGGTSSCDTSLSPKTLEIGFNSGCQDANLVDVGLRLNVRFRHVAASLGFMTYPCDNVSAIPATYEGVCAYQAFRGDSKVYLDGVAAPSSTGTTMPVPLASGTTGVSVDPSGIVYDSLRVFCKPVSGAPFSTLTTANECANLPIVGRTLNDTKIEGLTNNTAYEFLVANVDEAGNVTYFANPSQVGSSGVATPAPVSGLLDGKGCFIATATFGSPLAPEVATFRRFRDEILLRTNVGQRFVESYYRWSPPIAEVIAQSPLLRTASWVFLLPVLGFVKLALASHWVVSVLAFFGALAGSLSFFRRSPLRSQNSQGFRARKGGGR